MRRRSVERRSARRASTRPPRRASVSAERDSESVTSRVKNVSKSLLTRMHFSSAPAVPSVVQERDGLGAALDPELLLELRDVPPNRDRRDAELLGDPVRRVAPAQERRDLALPRRELYLAPVAAGHRA